MTDPLPVTIIGGYLGAGKTTLVNQMLRQANGMKLAVLVNEFGELPIDADLIEAQDDDLISIAGGCICCSFGSDLTAALMTLTDLSPRPDHLIIESSGVALPGSIALSVQLLDAVRVDGICVLADTTGIQTLAADEYVGDTIERQLSDADLVVLTKADLATPDTVKMAQVWLEHHWPDARQVVASQGRIANEILLGRISNGPTQNGVHADHAYDSVLITPHAPVDARALAHQLTDPALGVIRAKGHIDDISGARALIQIVGRRADITFPTAPATPGLICIGLKDTLNIAGLRHLEEI